MAEPLNAADVLAAVTGSGEIKVAALLAHGEQGVAILPDGTLWALDSFDRLTHTATAGVYEGAFSDDPDGIDTYRLGPVSAEAGDTDDPETVTTP